MVLANLGVTAINVHDAMWVETRRAVGEARNELDRSGLITSFFCSQH